LIERCSAWKAVSVDEYRTARFKTPSITFLKICRGWSDLNGTMYGSAACLWNTDVTNVPFLFSMKRSRNDTLVPSWPHPHTLTLKIYRFVEILFIRIFDNISRNHYYRIRIKYTNLNPVNTSVISRNLCQNISQLFNETILSEYSYLTCLKFYHLPCQQNHDLRCFYDEYRMCICTQDHFSDCYLFNHEYNHWNDCEHDGLCLRQNCEKERRNFGCLCQKCSFGIRC